jgi:hypothetical protein
MAGLRPVAHCFFAEPVQALAAHATTPSIDQGCLQARAADPERDDVVMLRALCLVSSAIWGTANHLYSLQGTSERHTTPRSVMWAIGDPVQLLRTSLWGVDGGRSLPGIVGGYIEGEAGSGCWGGVGGGRLPM